MANHIYPAGRFFGENVKFFVKMSAPVAPLKRTEEQASYSLMCIMPVVRYSSSPEKW